MKKMIKRALCLILSAVILTLSGATVFSNEAIKEEFLTFEMKTEEVGRIYSDVQSERNFTLIIKSNAESTFSGTLEYEILSEYDDVLYTSGEKKFVVNGIEGIAEFAECVPKTITKNGVYRLHMTVKAAGDGNYEALGEKTFEKMYHFSIAPLWLGTEERVQSININSHLYDWRLNTEEQWDIIQKMGVGGIRDGAQWDFIDNTGTLELGKVAGIFNSQKKSGLKQSNFMLGLFNPNVTNGRQTFPDTDAAIGQFVDYCEFIAQNTDFEYYEVWNEYNHAGFNPTNQTPEQYVKVLREVYTAIKKIKPDAKVGGAGSFTLFYDEVAAKLWQRMIDAGIGDCCDFWAVHGYSYPKAPDALGQYFDGAIKLRELLEKNGITDMEIIANEIGSPSRETWRQGMARSPASYPSEIEQGIFIPRLMAIMMADSGTDKSAIYCLADDRSEPFGLIRRGDGPGFDEFDNPHTAKRSFVTTTAYTRLVGNAKAVGKYKSEDNKVKIYKFEKLHDGSNTIIAWKDQGQETVNVQLGTTEAELYDMFGNSMGKVYSQNGIFALALSDTPIYIKGYFPEFEVTKEKPSVESENVVFECIRDDDVTITLKSNIAENLSVTIDSGNSTEIVENNGFINGECNIKLHSSNYVGDVPVIINVKDKSGRNIYAGQHFMRISAEDVDFLSIDTERVNNYDPGRWRSLVTIKNNSNSREITGNVKITAPADAAFVCNTAKFIDIKPGETATLRVNLPHMPIKQTRTFEYTVTLDNGQTTAYSKMLDFSSCTFAESKPVMDGIISEGEWGNDWLLENAKDKVYKLGGDWSGVNDLSMRVQTKFDKENFYIAVIAKDDTFYATGVDTVNLWQVDSIQFAMEDVIGRVNSSFAEIGFCLLDNKPVAYRYSNAYAMNNEELTNFDGAVKRDGKQTIYEFSIPWSELFYKGFDITKQKEIGFAMLVNDNDGNGRKQFIELNSGIGVTKNSNLFGVLKFDAETIKD